MKILIVEDDKDVLDFLSSSLGAEGFVIDTAEDGGKGTFMACNNYYDLIILDLNLPGKNGDAVCREIRKAEKIMPILIVTIETEIDDKVRLLNFGADDYLTKPFSFKELLARINALLRRPQKIEVEVFKIDNLILDTVGKTVKRGSKEIYLTRKEFALLAYLMKNQNKVLTRTMIMEHVWDMNADPFSSTIETHILNLRKKISQDNKKKIIQTVPGMGYKIS